MGGRIVMTKSVIKIQITETTTQPLKKEELNSKRAPYIEKGQTIYTMRKAKIPKMPETSDIVFIYLTWSGERSMEGDAKVGEFCVSQIDS